jgi:hypothetical protein
MTLIATLLFVGGLAASIGVIILTLRGALPRIREVLDMEFAPAMQHARRINFGEVRYCTAAEIIAFPVAATRKADDLLLAA